VSGLEVVIACVPSIAVPGGRKRALRGCRGIVPAAGSSGRDGIWYARRRLVKARYRL